MPDTGLPPDRSLPPQILIVDDEASLLAELKEFLSLHSVAVSAAGDGVQALAALAADPGITVALTDIRMPGVDGLTLAGRILGARGDADAIEVVMMTGHGTMETAVQAVRAGAFDFLQKPMEPEQLFAVLRSAHARALARRQTDAARTAELERLRSGYAALQERLARLEHPLALTGEAPAELAHILSHELRTPLVPIVALPDMLAVQESLPPGTLGAYLRDVQQAGERLQEIADDLIEFLAPPDAQAFAWRPAAPQGVLARLEEHCLAAAQKAGVTLAVAASAAGELESSSVHLVAALARLVANAITATRPGGRIALDVRALAPDRVAFDVRDNGCGMTAAEVELAKLPFRQLDMSFSRRGGGMGLGLPLAIRMAERLGGRLEITSAPGAGTTASIVLPRRRVAGLVG